MTLKFVIEEDRHRGQDMIKILMQDGTLLCKIYPANNTAIRIVSRVKSLSKNMPDTTSLTDRFIQFVPLASEDKAK